MSVAERWRLRGPERAGWPAWCPCPRPARGGSLGLGHDRHSATEDPALVAAIMRALATEPAASRQSCSSCSKIPASIHSSRRVRIVVAEQVESEIRA